MWNKETLNRHWTSGCQMWDKFVALFHGKREPMFGQPNWFREKSVGWGLQPITWQGWAYSAIWMVVICLPFVTLLAVQGPLEALVWMAVTVGVLLWDVGNILRAKRSPVEAGGADDDLFYIGDDEPNLASVTTSRYKLRTRG